MKFAHRALVLEPWFGFGGDFLPLVFTNSVKKLAGGF
jgi:hypothetical protein